MFYDRFHAADGVVLSIEQPNIREQFCDDPSRLQYLVWFPVALAAIIILLSVVCVYGAKAKRDDEDEAFLEEPVLSSERQATLDSVASQSSTDEEPKRQLSLTGPHLLRQYTDVADEPNRGEELYVVLCCCNEDEVELRHSISTVADLPLGAPSTRLFILVDGLQGYTYESLLHNFKQSKENNSDDLMTLRALDAILSLKNPQAAHGHLRYQGIVHGIPFELYVKGPGAPRSKRASHAEVIAIQILDKSKQNTFPSATLFLDADTRVEPAHLPIMYHCLQNQNLGACAPYLIPHRINTVCLLFQMYNYWVEAAWIWLGQSAFRMVFPVNGSCIMVSGNALLDIKLDYCRGLKADSIFDSMRVEMGEDSHMTNLLLEKGWGTRWLPCAHASAFMPETFLEWQTQQCRWKRSHLGNRTDLLFCRPRAWLGGQILMWPLYVISFIWTEHLGVGTLTLFTASGVGHIINVVGPRAQPSECVPWDMMVYISIWALVLLYCGLSAGVDVKRQPILHGIAMLLAFLASLCIWMFVWFGLNLLAVSLFVFLIVLPGLAMLLVHLLHGVRHPWVPLLALITPCLVLLKVVVQTSVAVANADGIKALWGTRGAEGESVAKDAALARASDIRVYKRHAFLASWLASNYAMGALVLALRIEKTFAALMLVAVYIFLVTHLVLGLGYALLQRMDYSPKESQNQNIKSAETTYGSF